MELEWFGARGVSCILQFGRLASLAAGEDHVVELLPMLDGDLSTHETLRHSMIAVVAVCETVG